MDIKFNSLFDNEVEEEINFYDINNKDNVLGLTDLVLNFDKQQLNENKIRHERNFGNTPNFVLGPRPCSTSLCNSNKFCDSSGWPTILFEDKSDPCENYFSPQGDKALPSKYFQNIEVENRLRNADYKDSKCNDKDFKKQNNKQLSCHKDIISKDRLILDTEYTKKETRSCKPIKNFSIFNATKRINAEKW